MTKYMTLNVRVSGPLGDFVAENVSSQGAYENASEYIRDLIRRDMERTEAQAFDRLRAELKLDFAAPEQAFADLDADAFMARHRDRTSA